MTLTELQTFVDQSFPGEELTVKEENDKGASIGVAGKWCTLITEQALARDINDPALQSQLVSGVTEGRYCYEMVLTPIETLNAKLTQLIANGATEEEVRKVDSFIRGNIYWRDYFKARRKLCE
jgi:hypothetical protein